MMPRLIRTRVLTVLALAPALGLASCGGIDGVQFEGKIFDVLGVSGSEQRREPKLADRAPLVVPPNTTKLPEPGSGKTSSDDLAALNDPELKKQAAAKDRERLHLAYCRGEIQWKDAAFNPDKTGANRSPYGPCPSLFSVDKITK
jgi:hypothetical protein